MMKDMTKGKIPSELIRFSIPLILGNLFQLTYNAVDSIIVGRWAGENALAAVGTANPVMNIVILGITGICIGASVLMSEFFGAGRGEQLKRQVSTTLIFGCFFSAVVVLLGVLLSVPVMRALRVPEEIFGDAVVYLRIIFLGMPFTYLYNAVASALRSVGDSRTPVRFLAMASVLNGCLDLVFVAGFGMGVVGAALATDIAEAVSAVLCVVYVYRKVPLLQLKREDIRMDRELLKLTLKHGSITALQQSCQPIGKLLIQGAINPLGVSTIAAFNAVNRVDDFAFTPEQSISHGITTFTAQNLGSRQDEERKRERVGAGLRTGLLLEFLYWIFIFLLVYLGRVPVMKAFVTGEGSTGVVEAGSRYLGTMAFFYLLPAFTNGLQGFFRGRGKMGITLAGTFIQTSLRVAVTYLTAPVLGIYGVTIACAVGWTAMLLFEVPCLFFFRDRTVKQKK